MNGNSHTPHDCPHCWRVLYSQGALTQHIQNEHWRELPYCEAQVGGMECGNPVKEWGQQCKIHDPKRETVK